MPSLESLVSLPPELRHALELEAAFPDSDITGTGGSISPFNRDMAANATSSNGDLACSIGLLATPTTGAWLLVFVNGVSYTIGNGTKIGVACYFSGNGGVTARGVGGLTMGDFLYWNGTIAGFQLDIVDKLDFVFEVT